MHMQSSKYAITFVYSYCRLNISVTHSHGCTDLQTLYVSKLYTVCQHCKGRRMHLVQAGEASLCVACCNEHTFAANWLNDGSLGILRQEAGELHSPCTHA